MLEGHEAYVDVGGWSPVTDVLVTASSDRNSYLWTPLSCAAAHGWVKCVKHLIRVSVSITMFS